MSLEDRLRIDFGVACPTPGRVSYRSRILPDVLVPVVTPFSMVTRNSQEVPTNVFSYTDRTSSDLTRDPPSNYDGHREVGSSLLVENGGVSGPERLPYARRRFPTWEEKDGIGQRTRRVRECTPDSPVSGPQSRLFPHLLTSLLTHYDRMTRSFLSTTAGDPDLLEGDEKHSRRSRPQDTTGPTFLTTGPLYVWYTRPPPPGRDGQVGTGDGCP